MKGAGELAAQLFIDTEFMNAGEARKSLAQALTQFANERVKEERAYWQEFMKLNHFEDQSDARKEARADALEEYRRECVQCSYQTEHVGNFEGHLCPHLKQAYERGLEEAAQEADNQEKTHHKYADSHEEGMRDMADLLAQAIRALAKKTL
jgi:hypothetical protein